MSAHDFVGFELFLQVGNLNIRAGDNTQLRSVVATDGHVAPQHWFDGLARQTNAHHAAAWQLFHGATAFGDHFQAIFKAKHARHTCGSEFADRMSHHILGINAPRQPYLG